MTRFILSRSAEPRPSRLARPMAQVRRRVILSALALAGAALLLPAAPRAQEKSGGAGGGGGHGGGETGGGSGGQGGGEAGGGTGAGKGKNASQRAQQHRQRTGRVLGNGTSSPAGHSGKGGAGEKGGGGHGAGGGNETSDPPEASVGTELPPDGSTTGPIGGGAGGEHFIHHGLGCWGADCKVLHGNI